MEQVNKSAGDGNASDSASQTGQQGFPLSREGGLSFCASSGYALEAVLFCIDNSDTPWPVKNDVRGFQVRVPKYGSFSWSSDWCYIQDWFGKLPPDDQQTVEYFLSKWGQPGMAEHRQFVLQVPRALLARFARVEAPEFEVVQSSEGGRVRLWKSTTTDHDLHGHPVRGSVRYHVTTDDEADYVLMPRLDAALASFDFAVQQAGEVSRG